MCYPRFLIICVILPMYLWTSSMAVPAQDGSLSTSAPKPLPFGDTKTTEALISNDIIINSTQSPPITTTLTTILTSKPTVPKVKPIPYPFVVSIQIYENGKFKHICGGAILDKEFVITAAHCTLKPRPLYARDLIVVAGSNVLYDQKAKRTRVRNLKKHPSFKPLYGHDIMLLHLASPLPIDNIRFATINFRREARKGGGLNSVLLGWGRTQPNRPKSLETVHFHTIPDNICLNNWRFRYLTNSEICAVNSRGPRGACDGDSGGPLVDMKQKSLYGLLSYGRKPCQTGKPFAFTRISVYVRWIQDQMRIMLMLPKRPRRGR